MRYHFVIYTDYNGEKRSAVVLKKRVTTGKPGKIRPTEAACTR